MEVVKPHIDVDIGIICRVMRVGVQVIHLPTGERMGVRARSSFPLASCVKIPLLVHAARVMEQGPASGI